MSSLLEQAFVDAKALKEAALKNAEATIVDKYSTEVKETLNKILEQDELGLGAPAAGMDPMGAAPAPAAGGDAAEDVPLGAAEGEELCACDDEDQETNIKINFDELAETLQRLEEELDEDTLEEDEEIELTEDDDEDPQGSGEMGDTGGSAGEGEAAAAQTAASAQQDQDLLKNMEEDIDMDSLVDAIMEKISLDEADKDGDGKPEAPKWSKEPGKKIPKWADKNDDDPEVQEEAQDELDESHCAGNRKKEEEDMQEELDADTLVDAVMERLTVDMGADLSGWAGRRAEDKMYEMEKALASRRSTGLEQETHLGRGMADRTDTDPQTELEDLKQAQEELVFENNQLKEKLQNYENVVEQLKESVTDVNLSNARLLYTNRVLRNTSLNERQKQKVAEAISKAGSVPEAKTIFETLQSTVESTPKRGPQSLSETINRRSSILRASNYSEAKKADPIADRMKKLAGIN